MPNRATLRDGIIYTAFSGDQTYATVSTIGQEIESLIAKLRATGQPVLILVDLTTVANSFDSAARTAGSEMLKHFDYDRIAIYGSDALTFTLVSLIVRASGQGRKIKYFGTEAEALTFLHKELPKQ